MSEKDKSEKVVLPSGVAVSVDINPEQVNRAIAQAVLQSGIGKQVEESINKYVEEIGKRDYYKKSPFDEVVRTHIYNFVKEIILKEYLPDLEAIVKEKMTKELMGELFETLWQAFHKALEDVRNRY